MRTGAVLGENGPPAQKIPQGFAVEPVSRPDSRPAGHRVQGLLLEPVGGGRGRTRGKLEEIADQGFGLQAGEPGGNRTHSNGGFPKGFEVNPQRAKDFAVSQKEFGFRAAHFDQGGDKKRLAHHLARTDFAPELFQVDPLVQGVLVEDLQSARDFPHQEGVGHAEDRPHGEGFLASGPRKRGFPGREGIGRGGTVRSGSCAGRPFPDPGGGWEPPRQKTRPGIFRGAADLPHPAGGPGGSCQAALQRPKDAGEHEALVAEADFGLLGVDVHVHPAGRNGKFQEEGGIVADRKEFLYPFPHRG